MPAHVGDAAEAWEKVARKLRTREMPPPGRPRPDDSTYGAVAAALEAALDAASAARPNPGRVPVHRLNRTEYANAIRDLLALEDRRPIAAAGRRAGPPGLRQCRQRPVGLTRPAGELPVRGLDGQPARHRRSHDQSGRRHLQDSHRAGPGRSHERGAAVRVARRHGDSLSLSARRRVQHQGRAEAAAVSVSDRHGRAAPDRRAPGRRAASSGSPSAAKARA